MVAAAVIIHLVTDGTYYGDQKQETISVQLLDTKEQIHDLGKHVFWAWFTLGTSFHVWLPSPFYKGCPPSTSLSLASSLLGVLVALINTWWCIQRILDLTNVRKQIQ